MQEVLVRGRKVRVPETQPTPPFGECVMTIIFVVAAILWVAVGSWFLALCSLIAAMVAFMAVAIKGAEREAWRIAQVQFPPHGGDSRGMHDGLADGTPPGPNSLNSEPR